ncbi:hypothetical protein C6P46_004178 [Rhodotorula mucilaginosa]|uniref:PH domain-containing protein n=1 Tax=Rhodotorula mucilaginosa TaxID=5537 RepID=A0A9P7B5K6_RHOMI|nr:hypothetical protein C6P46_004178 [Rhodotorula mucilaginosa]
MAESLVPSTKPSTNHPLTPQEIELKLASPSLTAPGSIPPTAYSADEPSSLLERRASSATRRPSHSSAITSGTDGGSSSVTDADDLHHHHHNPPSSPPLHRASANLPLSAISETEDALGSGSDAESDTSSLAAAAATPGASGGGAPRALGNAQAGFFGQGAGAGGAFLEPVRTSRDSGGLSENVTLKSGYLMKKGERRKAWKKRWFVLRGGQLAMYKTDKEYRLLRLIPLFDIHAVAPVELKKHSHAFGIVTPRRTYYVTADSASEVQSWCRQIEAAKAEYAARATRLSLDTPTPTGTGTEGYPTPVAGTTPIPSPRHAVDAAMMMTTQQQQPERLVSPSDTTAAAYPRGIAIPGTSAPPTNGSFAPASYATTASSSFNGGGSTHHPGATTLGTSYASTSSSSLGGGGSRAPPNSLVTPAPFPSSSSSSASPPSSSATSSSFDHHHHQRTGLGLHSPTGLDARLEQLDLDGTGAFGMGFGSGFGMATAPDTTSSSSLQRATSSRRTETSPAGRSVSSSAGVGMKEAGAAAAAPSTRDRSASTATTGGSSSLAVPPPSTGGGGFVSSSDDEEAYEPGSEYPTFSPSGLVAPTTLGGPPSATQQQSLSSPPLQHQQQQQQQQQARSGSGFADPNKVILSGYLMKQGKRKTWRKRWFVLTSGMLMYSRSHMDQKYNRQIPLSSILDAIEYEAPSPSSPHAQKRSSNATNAGATSPHGGPSLGVGGGHGGGGVGVGATTAGGPGGGGIGGETRALEHAFKIITPKRTYLVCAPSEEDEIKWLAALQCLVARRNQQAHAAGATAATATATAPPPPAPAIAPPVPSTGLASHTTSTTNPSAPPPPTTATTTTEAPPARRPSQTGPPPVSRPSIHGRHRSVTDAARQAVRDVELRFQGKPVRVAAAPSAPAPVSSLGQTQAPIAGATSQSQPAA